MSVLDRVAVLEEQREVVQAREEERWEFICRRLDELESALGTGKAPGGTGVHALSVGIDASPLREAQRGGITPFPPPQAFLDFDLTLRLDRIEDLLRHRGAGSDAPDPGAKPEMRVDPGPKDPMIPKRGSRFVKKATGKR